MLRPVIIIVIIIFYPGYERMQSGHKYWKGNNGRRRRSFISSPQVVDANYGSAIYGVCLGLTAVKYPLLETKFMFRPIHSRPKSSCGLQRWFYLLSIMSFV